MGTRTALFSRNQPGGVFSIQDLQAHPGDIWFVDSGCTTGSDAAGYGKNPDKPFATLDYAIGNCTASNGDVIYLMPGHAENLTGATSLTMDVAGVKVVGLGWGTTTPTFTLTTATTATWNITAANCWVENVRVIGNFLDIATAFTIGALADGLTLKNIYTADTSAILGALIQISIAAACHDVTIDGYRHVGFAGGLTAPATNVILAAGTCDRLILTNSTFHAHTSAAVVDFSADACAHVFVKDVFLLNTDTSAGLGIAFHNSSTGYVDDVTTINLKNTIKGVTGTGLSIGARVNYSNAVNAYAGLFSYSVDT